MPPGRRLRMRGCFFSPIRLLLVAPFLLPTSLSFVSVPSMCSFRSSALQPHATTNPDNNDDATSAEREKDAIDWDDRRSFLSKVLTSSVGASAIGTFLNPTTAIAADPTSSSASFESIAARAAKISQTMEAEEGVKAAAAEAEASTKKKPKVDLRTAYDFSLPVEGKVVPFEELVRQEYEEEIKETEDGFGSGGVGMRKGKVKAILVVNIKQDDPIARKNIPELIALGAKYGRSGEFVVVCSPTDQGYYEPDTSALIRLKMASEYGYGINPATTLTDKVILLGTGAHPFWRWLEGTCRTPAGIGRIEANFEKFLLDGQTGLPLRRYPRKYQPYDIQDDIEAVLAGKPLPPPGFNFKEEWRNAANEAERDTYRFQKGLNWFDQ